MTHLTLRARLMAVDLKKLTYTVEVDVAAGSDPRGYTEDLTIPCGDEGALTELAKGLGGGFTLTLQRCP